MAISVDVPQGLEEDIESEVEKGRYKSKSELIRDAVRRLLEESVERKISQEVQKRIDQARKERKIPDENLDEELEAK
jgi:putative addiction module CopG family antidote